ncbi:MAG: LD-carboxypeptidase [Bacteroidales bacterium]|nr:LD-carboxypeptidase [Bacteroidales bacterium]
MIQPPYLKKGDKVGIVSPARCISFEEVHPAIRLLQRFNLEVVLGTHVFSRDHQLAGTDLQRIHDLQQMLDDPQIRAILCSRGGYGMVRIIDRLDFTRFCQNPKWIIGFSDITVLHSHIHQRFGIETLHAVMPVNIKSDKPDESVQTMLNAIFGYRISYTWPRSPLSRNGTAQGILTGGNLSILANLSGTASDIDTTGKILFLEDLDEYLYHIDRMMLNLKRSGKLTNLAGLIVGGMTGMRDNAIPFGKTAAEIVADAVKEHSYPVVYDFPAGHTIPNLALVLGRKATLKVDAEAELTFA